MRHYNYQKQLVDIWEKSVKLYSEGNKDASTYFDDEQMKFLDYLGVTAQEIFDFAEDFVNSSEPDFATFAMIHDIRRAYFHEVQRGQRSEVEVQSESLPPKDAEVAGVKWLPRIIPKAKAKLRGEMNPDLMYGCGGDRGFFKDNDIHPAEFLRVAWAFESDEEQIVNWVLNRKQTAEAEPEPASA